MQILNKLKQLIFPIRFSKVPEIFIAKDGLFEVTFTENWNYYKSGNSYYSFHHNDLNGGLQFSIIWNKPVFNSKMNLEGMKIVIEEEEKVEIQTISISDNEALYYNIK